MDDESLGGAVARGAGAQGQFGRGGGVDDRDVVRAHRLAADHVVLEGSLGGGDVDGVAGDQLVQIVEGVEVGGPVAGDGGIAGLPGERRPRVVPRALLEPDLVGALDHHHRQADRRDVDGAHRTPDGRGGDRGGDLG